MNVRLRPQVYTKIVGVAAPNQAIEGSIQCQLVLGVIITAQPNSFNSNLTTTFLFSCGNESNKLVSTCVWYFNSFGKFSVNQNYFLSSWAEEEANKVFERINYQYKKIEFVWIVFISIQRGYLRRRKKKVIHFSTTSRKQEEDAVAWCMLMRSNWCVLNSDPIQIHWIQKLRFIFTFIRSTSPHLDLDPYLFIFQINFILN